MPLWQNLPPPPFYFISIHLILLLQKKLENILLLPVKLNVNIVIKYSLHYSELIFGFGVIFQTRRTFKVHIFFIEYAHRQCIQIVRQKHTHTQNVCCSFKDVEFLYLGISSFSFFLMLLLLLQIC